MSKCANLQISKLEAKAQNKIAMGIETHRYSLYKYRLSYHKNSGTSHIGDTYHGS
jgi:hypothetical protein